MPGGIGRRYAPPPPPVAITRNRAPGLGGSATDLADGTDARINELESTTPTTGQSGIVSRSRFPSPLRWPTPGHGAAQAGSTPVGMGLDPAVGRTQFGPDHPDPSTELPARAERMATLGTEQVNTLIPLGLLRFFRHRIDTTRAGTKLQDPNAMGWGKAPFPRAYRQPRFTLRREFQQGAQNFMGLHTVMVKGAHMSTSTARMGPARTNRLTRRAAPGSFGQTTRVMN